MSGSYAVHIGGGLYLDEAGTLTSGPSPDAQVYTAPAGFRVDTAELRDAFKSLGGLLPSSKEDVEMWVEYGAPRGLVVALSKIAGLATITATAVAVYAWAIGVLIKIMDMMADDALSPELAKALSSIKNQLKGDELIARANVMIDMHSQLDGRIDRVNGLLVRLDVEKPTGAARAAVFAEMRDVVDELSVPLSRIRNQEWAATYDAESYKGRAFASSLLVSPRSDEHPPAGSDGVADGHPLRLPPRRADAAVHGHDVHLARRGCHALVPLCGHVRLSAAQDGGGDRSVRAADAGRVPLSDAVQRHDRARANDVASIRDPDGWRSKGLVRSESDVRRRCVRSRPV